MINNNKVIKKACRSCGTTFEVKSEQENDIFGHEIVWCSEVCKSKLHLCECRKCFKEYYSSLPNSRHCSEECKKENCLVCNNIFIPTTVLKHHCSDRCKKIYYTHVCICCGDNFYKEQKNAKFCTNECRIAFKEVKKMAKRIICKNCKTIFAFIDDNAQFCSPDCRIEYVAKGRGIHKYNWQDDEERKELFKVVKAKVEIILKRREDMLERRIISTPNFWSVSGFTDAIKEKVRQRDGYACYVCEDTKTLEVHHILPRKLGGSHDEDNLVTLCVKCHRAVETGNTEHAIKKCYNKALNVIGRPVSRQKSKDVIYDAALSLNNIYEELAEKNIHGEFEEVLIKLDDLLDDINSVKL